MPFTTTPTTLTKKALAILLATLMLLSVAPSADEKHIAVYSPVASYTLPVLDRSGHEYVGLLELLEPLGRVSTQSDGRRLRLRYNAVDADFFAGKTRAKIHGRDFDFGAPFLIENSRGLVPLSSLSALLPRFVGTPVNFHESARRLFIGIAGIQPSFRLDAGNPPRLLLNFSAPVNPTISTEPGRLRMVFKRDPVVSPGSQSISFDNKVITHASYSENNGDAELDVAANEPLMASFADDRKTIVISAVIAPVQQTPAAPSGVGTGTGTGTGTGSQNPAQARSAANIASGNNNNNNNVRRVLAVVDPAHGGDERGAALTDQLAEKVVTLGFARLLRHELEIRGFAVALLRDADTSLTLDQRAAAANVARAVVYISLHAVSQGSGAQVYTALLPVEGTSNGIFRAWNAAQAPALPVSRMVSAAIVAEMQKREFPVRASSASLRPLNNVFMPAVAVELAPGADGVADLTSANYQQRAAAAIADAVVSVRDRLGVQP
ncbi:MAG TPA: N-acetylmuramoyl-L-alanine amidase [Terriglobales bacterium]|nr:N-acetylmuramoyl-L-alanine amidase [Terriglobales bacterium]